MKRSLVIFSVLMALFTVNVSAQTPELVKIINPSYHSSPRNAVEINGIAYFIAASSVSFSSTGNDDELWRTDGTTAGTWLVKDIRPGAAGSNIQFMTVVGNTLYFSANNGTQGQELWKSDGTTAGTLMVGDIVTGSGGMNPRHMINFNGTLYFIGDGNGTYAWLMKSDGTQAGTVLVSTKLEPNYQDPALYRQRIPVFNGKMYFLSGDRTNFTTATIGVWESDGTAAGTVLVKAVPNTQSDLMAADNQLFFSANDPVYKTELWRSDGTAAGTYMVKDINPFNSGFNGSSIWFLYTTIGNVCLF